AVRSAESVGVRQPAKSKIRRHNNRLSTVFNYSPNLREASRRGPTQGGPDPQAADDPAELSSQRSIPGILKIFGSDICQGAHYKSVLATSHSSARELVREALERYCLEKEDASDYVLCDVIGQTGADHEWRRECFRVVGANERPLLLQALWKPKEGFFRRFEIQHRSTVEQQSLKHRDTITAGVNAQARKLQKNRSRVASLFVDSGGEDMEGPGFRRSLSDMDLSATEREAGRAQRSAVRENPEAEADTEVLRLGLEKEETESSDDNAMQYSIHPPFDFPYFLLLQGYDHRDFVIYLMSGSSTIFGYCKEHSTGEDEERLKVDILLFAPDVSPQHCCVRRLDSNSQSSSGKQRKTVTLLRPLHGAPVTRNGFLLDEEVELNPGDLIGLGKHYLFLFKDPTGGSGSPPAPPWMARLRPGSDTGTSCSSCGSCITVKRLQGKLPASCWRSLEGTEAALRYELQQEERVLQEILDMVDPSENEPKLTPAFLLILCIRRSAGSFQLTHFRQLLLRIASQIQLITWEKTKELAAMQPEASSVDDAADQLQQLSLEELISGLRPLVLWMANSIELLHFIQHEVPQLLPWRRDSMDQERLQAELWSTQSACEEAMTVLEEVIMFTFQQSVYYLTKSMYPALGGLLDGNPFSEDGQLRLPVSLSKILQVLKEALELLSAFQVHPDISLQLCAYLFFFINASLFNSLMERGSVAGFYQWSRGVQIRANLDLLMDWVQNQGLASMATQFLQKLSAAVNLLATPKETLLQASWASLRAEFAALTPAQLHHMLREYGGGKPRPPGWSPAAEEAEDALRTADVLLGLDRHPPLILPSSCFQLESAKVLSDPVLLEQLARLQAWISRLPLSETQSPGSVLERTQVPDRSSSAGPTATRPSPDGKSDPLSSSEPGQGRESHGDLSRCEAVLAQKLKNLQLQNALPGPAGTGYHKSLALDPSCLLTPPNTPQGPEPGEPEAPHTAIHPSSGREAGLFFSPSDKFITSFIINKLSSLLCAVGGSGDVELGDAAAEEDREEVFTVEIHRGPHGLGLALVDGKQTVLRMSGIYVKSVVPDSPAARCGKLRTGDRILAVNGTSLVGMEYSIGRELIRSAGDALRLLVAKMDTDCSSRNAAAATC
uniref:Ras association and DIL domains 2a n=1 Tax=Poecilia formosa TaxID=48698 RepID=A0A087XMQ2_POEFO